MQLLYKKYIKTVSFLDLRLFVQGFFLSILFEIICSIFPFKYYLFFLGNNSLQSFSNNPSHSIRMVYKCMKRISKISPCKFSCLTKALVTKLLLNGLGISNSLVLGLAKNTENTLLAHAYIRINHNNKYFYKLDYEDVAYF
jgi:hypothetical protein